jgi:hypothetical protein
MMSDRERDAAIQQAIYNPGAPNVDLVDDDEDAMIPMGNMYNQPSDARRTRQ